MANTSLPPLLTQPLPDWLTQALRSSVPSSRSQHHRLPENRPEALEVDKDGNTINTVTGQVTPPNPNARVYGGGVGKGRPVSAPQAVTTQTGPGNLQQAPVTPTTPPTPQSTSDPNPVLKPEAPKKASADHYHDRRKGVSLALQRAIGGSNESGVTFTTTSRPEALQRVLEAYTKKSSVSVLPPPSPTRIDISALDRSSPTAFASALSTLVR